MAQSKGPTVHEPGYYIPMSDFDREFLRLRNLYVHNPEMEEIMKREEEDQKKRNAQRRRNYQYEDQDDPYDHGN